MPTPSQEPKGTHVLVHGDPAGGFTFIGPITPNDPGLDAFTATELRDAYWWYVPLETPPWETKAAAVDDTWACPDHGDACVTIAERAEIHSHTFRYRD